MIVVDFRMESCILVLTVELYRKFEATTGEMQDKNPHIAAIFVGCVDCYFLDFLHIAPLFCDVHSFILLTDFSRNRTSQVPAP